MGKETKNSFLKKLLSLEKNTKYKCKCIRIFGIEIYKKRYLPKRNFFLNGLFSIENNGQYKKYFWKDKKLHTKKKSNVKFPDSAKKTLYESRDEIVSNTRRCAVFASFSSQAIISESVLYYLNELKKVTDAIIFIADNPLMDGEFDKIKDLVFFAKMERHEKYDFGSYQIGYEYIKAKKLDLKFDEIIFCNDSCYGPIFPFGKLFEEMKSRNCDFWGLTTNSDVQDHLQSFFLVFRKKVIDNTLLSDFLSQVREEMSYLDAVYYFEIQLTKILENAGFISDSYIAQHIPEVEENYLRSGSRDTNRLPYTMLSKYQMPFVKKKVMNGKFENCLAESVLDVLLYVKEKNKDLYNIIVSEVGDKNKEKFGK